MTSKVSTHVKNRIPSTIRDENPLFVDLMEAYYEYLEQVEDTRTQGFTIERSRNLRNYMDIDKTLDGFLKNFYKQFLSLIPRNSEVDKRLLLKHIRDFYRSRGTEKSYKFLVRLMSTGTNDVEFYYPKQDILRASDSTWYIQKTLRLLDIKYNGVAVTESDLSKFYLFENQLITGEDSGATAIVDNVDHFYNSGFLIDELTLSSINGTFSSGENVTSTFTSTDNVAVTLTGTINPGVVSSITVRTPGYGYEVGYVVPIEEIYDGFGSNAVAVVAEVTTGTVNAISVIYGGSGYRTNDLLLITADIGYGANAYLSSVYDTGVIHANSYIIDVSTIELEANTLIGNTTYSNLNTSNANVQVINAVSTFVYANTGPAAFVAVTDAGSDYISVPDMSVIGNTRIQALGILGRLNIINRGLSYQVGDILTFNNVLGGHGFGANGRISAVAGNGAIMNVEYTQFMTGLPLGGWGYENDFLPSVSITTSGGTGGSVTVAETLGSGATFMPTLTTIGGIARIDVISGGIGYNVAPYINLTASGSGTANAYANINLGLYTYPGRYLDDTGHVSSYNFLQNRDYYQNHSYVIRVDEALSKYRRAIEQLLHPAGLKLFAEYIDIMDDLDVSINVEGGIDSTTEFYVPECVFFDGNARFSTTTTVTKNIHDGIINVWFRPDRLPTGNDKIHLISFNHADRGYLAMTNRANSNTGTGVSMEIDMFTNGGTEVIRFWTDPEAIPITTNTFYHLLASYSTDSSKCNVYINEVSCKSNVVTNPTGQTLSGDFVTVGGTREGTDMFRGTMAEIMVSNTYLDISVSSNRLLFSSNLLPVNLSSGILASNVNFIPIMYFKSNAAYANTNSGRGNSFSNVIASFTTSNVSMHDY